MHIYRETETETETERVPTEVGSGVVERQREVIGDVIERERMVGKSRVSSWVVLWTHFLSIDEKKNRMVGRSFRYHNWVGMCLGECSLEAKHGCWLVWQLGFVRTEKIDAKGFYLFIYFFNGNMWHQNVFIE